MRWERAQSAGRSRDESIMPDAVGSTESLASVGPRDSFQSQPHHGFKQGKVIYHNTLVDNHFRT